MDTRISIKGRKCTLCIFFFQNPLQIRITKKNPASSRAFRDLVGARTQGPYIKSVLLYQLSYEIETVSNGMQR
jgi:hypothetical protein